MVEGEVRAEAYCLLFQETQEGTVHLRDTMILYSNYLGMHIGTSKSLHIIWKYGGVVQWFGLVVSKWRLGRDSLGSQFHFWGGGRKFIFGVAKRWALPSCNGALRLQSRLSWLLQ